MSERRHDRYWRCSGVFIFNFEQISHIFLMFPLLSLTLSWRMPLSYRNHLICGANQWTGFYMITASVMKGLIFSVESKISDLLSWRMEYFQSPTFILSGFDRSAKFFWKVVFIWCVKSIRVQSYSGPHSGYIQRDTKYISVLSPNSGKRRPEYLRIWTLFT